MKKLLIVAAVLVVLLGVTYFVVTSSGFLKSVILPRASAALNARVEAESIALSPFSSVEIRKLSVVPNGAESLATVDTVRVRYSLFAILGGNLAVDEILVSQPSVTVVQKADGTSNLDPILKKMSEGAKETAPAPDPAAKPPKLDLKSLRVEGGQLTYRSTAKDGSQMAAEVGGLNFAVQNLRNGGSGRIDLGATLKLDQRGGQAGAV
ncbi:MAG: AsmA family protein, partial [Verrucomicrobiales bacterium]|nr:AsmA family protein [Verrucomicrobiales bacterium]